MAVLHSIVGPATDFLFVGVAEVFHRCLIGGETVGSDLFRRPVALESLLHEGQRGIFVPGPGDTARKDLALMVHGTPEVDHLSVELHIHLVKMPAPVAEPAHRAHSLPTDIASEHRPEPVPPHPDRLVAEVDTALEQQVLAVAQTQWKANIREHHQADHLG